VSPLFLLSPPLLRKKKPLLFSFNFRQRSSSSFFSSSICLSLISQLRCFTARSFVNFSSSSFFSSSICLSLISQLCCFSARSFMNFSSCSFFSSSICLAFFCQSLFLTCSILRFSCRELHIVCKVLNLISQLSSFSARSFVNLSSRAVHFADQVFLLCWSSASLVFSSNTFSFLGTVLQFSVVTWGWLLFSSRLRTFIFSSSMYS
ncbi:hypothetical protein FQN60_006754, partial [Etheostoma spectabile]